MGKKRQKNIIKHFILSAVIATLWRKNEEKGLGKSYIPVNVKLYISFISIYKPQIADLCMQISQHCSCLYFKHLANGIILNLNDLNLTIFIFSYKY